MKNVGNKWIGIFTLLLTVVILVAASLYLPWWSVNISKEASGILNSDFKVEYYLHQNVVATEIINNETRVVSASLTSLAENEDSLKELSLWFSITQFMTALGLGLSCLILGITVLTRSRRIFYKYMKPIGYITAVMLLLAPLVLMLNFSAAISKLSKLAPIDTPSTWPPIKPTYIKSFWGAVEIAKSNNLPEWAVGGNFWVWGGDIGWYLIFVAALIMFFAVWVVSKIAITEESPQLSQEKPLRASLLAMIGGVLMLTNGVLIGVNKGPLMFSTSTVSSPVEIVRSDSFFWGRISFGIRGLVEGYATLFWLVLPLIIIYCSLRLYIEPIKRRVLGFLIVFLAILSISFGGGFIIGLILAVLGGCIGFQWPTPPQETLFGRIIRVAKLDGKVYRSLKDLPDSLANAIYILLLANVLGGLGCGIYALFTEKIVGSQSLDIPFRILMLGEAPLQISVFSPAIIGIAVTMLKWFLLSLIIFLVCRLSFKNEISLENIGVIVGFAYAPLILQVFMPVLLTSTSFLYVWPLALIFITKLWAGLALMVGIKNMLDTSWSKTLGIASLSGAFYLWIDQKFFVTLDIPYSVRFLIKPESVLLLISACLAVLAVLVFGVFKRR